MLTAAHCVTDSDGALDAPTAVRLGWPDLHAPAPPGGEEFGIARIIPHPTWTAEPHPAKGSTDLALIVLDGTSSNVPVALPAAGLELDEGAAVWAAGYRQARGAGRGRGCPACAAAAGTGRAARAIHRTFKLPHTYRTLGDTVSRRGSPARRAPAPVSHQACPRSPPTRSSTDEGKGTTLDRVSLDVLSQSDCADKFNTFWEVSAASGGWQRVQRGAASMCGHGERATWAEGQPHAGVAHRAAGLLARAGC